MSIEERTVFRACGKEFESRKEAEEYEAGEALRVEANAFAAGRLASDDKEPAVRSITRTVNVIVAWEEWKRAQEAKE